MNKHQLTYIDMHPAPVTREPSPVRIWAGAALFMLALWGVLTFAFSL